MTPEDSRHGTERGHVAHIRSGVPICEDCRDAHRKLNTLRLLYPDRYRRVPTIGSRRRLQALQALGHGRDTLAAELGYSDGGSIAYIMSAKSKTVRQATDRRIREVYDRLSMTVPQGVGPARARTWAKRHGYAPPLAWDNIDDPDETPKHRHGAWEKRSDAAVDPVAIERRLAGDKAVRLTKQERTEAMAQWIERDLGSLIEFERRTGINPGRHRNSAHPARKAVA